MSADLDPRDADLAARLRALGTRPVDPALQSDHLTAIASVGTGSAFRNALAGRLKVGAGVLAGILIGATGLTTAGAMGPLQSISAKAVEAATPLEVSHGKSAEAKAKHAGDESDGDDADGAEGEAKGSKVLEDGSIGTARDWSDDCVAGEGGKFAGNRGLYLKQERAKGEEALQAAKDSTCGLPLADDDEATTDADETKAETEGAETESGKPADPGADGKAKAAANKDADHGKSGEAGTSDEAGKPATTPAGTPDDHADDDAQSKAPVHTPGTPAGGGSDDDAVAATSADS